MRGDTVLSVNIICDFDGTISPEDVTDGILSRFAEPEWVEIETAWKSGLIGSRECMRDQIALVQADKSEIDRYLDSVSIDPHFPAFTAFCNENSIKLNIVSDGIDYAIHRILSRYKLGPLSVMANRLKYSGASSYGLEFPYAKGTCTSAAGTCKCDIARGAYDGRAAYTSTLLIGDGASDYCVARHVDFTFAKDRLLEHCRSHGLPHVQFTDFDHARLLLVDFIDALFIPLEVTRI